MSQKEVIRLLDEMVEMEEIYSAIDIGEMMGKMTIQDSARVIATVRNMPQNQAEEFLEKAKNAILELRAALLDLSTQEAKDIMKMTLENKTYNQMIGRSMPTGDEGFVYRHSISFSKVFFPDVDPVLLLLDKMLKQYYSPEQELRNMVSPSQMNSKEFRGLQEKALPYVISLKSLYNDGVIDNQFVGLALDVFHFRKLDDLEELSNKLVNLVGQSDNLDNLERVAKIWEGTLPDTYDIKLRKLALESTKPKIQEIVSKFIYLMGKDPTQIIQGAKIVKGDNIEISNVTNAQIAVKSRAVFKGITQTVGDSSKFNQTTKDELEKLIERLNQELEPVPAEHAKDANTVAERTKQLVEAANEEEPDKKFLDISAERLLKAAENIAKAVPVVSVVVDIAKQIVKLLVG
jgi:hypothetical protein